MTSDAHGFGQFSFLYAQLLTKNACMASVENGKTRFINEDKQIDQKKDARSTCKREVTLIQNDECTKAHFYIKLRREKKNKKRITPF